MSSRDITSHAYGMAPASVYKMRIKDQAERLAWLEQMCHEAEDEGMRSAWQAKVTTAKRALTASRNRYERAVQFETGEPARRQRQAEAAAQWLAKNNPAFLVEKGITVCPTCGQFFTCTCAK